jgi:hypothetical protein
VWQALCSRPATWGTFGLLNTWQWKEHASWKGLGYKKKKKKKKKRYGSVVRSREMLHRVTGAKKWAGSQGIGEINGDGPGKNPWRL